MSAKTSFKLQILFVLGLGLVGCAKPGPDANSGSTPPSRTEGLADSITSESPELQTLSRDLNFKNLMADLDFNAAGQSLEYKTSGTSLGLGLFSGAKKIGKWMPPNGAANPEAQVVGYFLGRYMHMSENVAPSAYYTLTGRALSSFHQMLKNRSESNQWREENRQSLLQALQKDPRQMFGIFMDSPSTFEVTELQSGGTLNARHPLAGFIRAEGPQPSPTRRITFKDVPQTGGKVPSETELELARQLSKTLVLDVLLGQWDRWSGGNLEAAVSKSDARLYFIARDNGGASLESGGADRGLNLVSRFDRTQITLLKQLLDQLNDANQRPRLLTLLQIRSSPKLLVERVRAVLAKVETQSRRYGSGAFFSEAP